MTSVVLQYILKVVPIYYFENENNFVLKKQ